MDPDLVGKKNATKEVKAVSVLLGKLPLYLEETYLSEIHF